MTWDSPKEIGNYHVVVSAGSGSLLRYVNLDFKKFKEFDIPAKSGKMEYTFNYDQNTDPENGTKLKFEIYDSNSFINALILSSMSAALLIKEKLEK